MQNLAKAGTEQLVDVVDHASGALIVAIRETNNSLGATAQAAINVEGKTVNAALDEAEGLRQQYIDSLRKIVGAVVSVES